jgi:molybdopterin molybdotransferase
MKLLSIEAAQALILETIAPLSLETHTLVNLAGRVLATPIIAKWPLPGWDNSAMDGYALRTQDVVSEGTVLPIRHHIAAGDGQHLSLEAGEAARIFTGALLPHGADAIVIQENTQMTPVGVKVLSVPVKGQNIRRAGSDIVSGQTCLEAGRVLTPGDISLLASQGYVEAEVFRRPDVTIMTTGNELCQPGSGRPQRGQIIDGNSVAIATAVRACDGCATVLPPLPDDAEATVNALEHVVSDVVITTGGASVGAHDHVRGALGQICGDSLKFWKVAIKPGKPIIFGHRNEQIFFGLPGNPVSALVTFEIFVRPALLALQGHTQIMRQPFSAKLENQLSAGGGRDEYRRGRCWNTHDGPIVRVFDKQSSGALSSISGADVLVRVPRGAQSQAVGSLVNVTALTNTVLQMKFKESN